MEERRSTKLRKTKETDIEISINLDGTGKSDIDTGIGFFNHMLDAFSRHALFDLNVRVKGDLEVDSHHTIEDTGIVLGEAIKEALGAKSKINRYGNFLLPMDESLVLVAVDLGGRPYLNFDARFEVEKIGDLDTEMIKEFFYAVSYSAMMNLHIKVMDGDNAHHIVEAMFKGFAKAMLNATSVNERLTESWTTKGSI